jgi:choline dehydrogenase-like flavoprotein
VLVDGRSLPDGATLNADIAIIGAGPAGLTVASELRHLNQRIILVETGGELASGAADQLSRLAFSSPHFPSPEPARRRRVGGMAHAWNNYLRDGTPAAKYLPLDPLDFDERSWVPNSGWPVPYEEMSPYYVRARTICGLPSFDFHADVTGDGEIAPLLPPGQRLVTRLDQIGPAAIFTRDILDQIRNSSDVDLIEHATVYELENDGSGGRSQCVARTSDDRRLSIVSSYVLIAGGAIENARLLLNSTTDQAHGLGNQNDNVGRFYMDHPRVTLGYGSFLRTPSDMGLYVPHLRDGVPVQGRIVVVPQIQRSEHLLNGICEIIPRLLGAEDTIALRTVRAGMEGGRARGPRLASLLRALSVESKDLAHAMVALAGLSVEQRHLRPRLQPVAWSPFTSRLVKAFKLEYQPEQAPNFSNRVSLGREKDHFGYPIARLEWRWTDLDLDSIRRTREIVSRDLFDCGFGLLAKSWDDPLIAEGVTGSPETAHHHLGTTRMHRTEKLGVVDRNCQIFGATNIYVLGGSVFPTSGGANPTLTVVALAIRLADHLRGRMDKRRVEGTTRNS